MSLLEQVASYVNLDLAFRSCARGKRRSEGYEKLLYGWPEAIGRIHHSLLKNTYRFSPYRQFVVHDPKARTVSAPSFQDRVVHTAICQVIEPMIDKTLAQSVYACRKGMGSRFAVIDLISSLRKIGHHRFVTKLDVEAYFDSINHKILKAKLSSVLPDRSLDSLIERVLTSFTAQRGLPIGSLASQLFANFYLSTADEVILKGLGPSDFYFRYMDDFVIGTTSKAKTTAIADDVVKHVTKELRLTIPFHKRHPLGADPVPFLGFVVSHDTHRILARNRRRHRKQMRRLKSARASTRAEVQQSFAAWQNLEPHLSLRLGLA